MNLNPFRRAPEEETRAYTDAQLIDLAMGFSSSVNQSFNVTQETALTSNAVLACLIVRAETFASLPVHVYKSSGDSREAVPDPLGDIISAFANPLMTSTELWRWKQLTEDIRGRAHFWVERQGGSPIAFWPMTNREIQMRYDPVSREAVYKYGGDSIIPKGEYSGRDVLHFRGPLVKDAWDGTSLVDQAKTAIGLTVSSERFYDRLLGNGNHFPGHLETDTSLKKEDITALAEQFKLLAGVEHAGELRIFDRGLKYVQNAMSIKDADLTAQQTWYLQEICRIFRVPPSLVQDWSRSTYTNSEQADLWFAKHTILPIAINTEKTLNRLFVRRNVTDRFVKFELDGLLRGDYQTRAEGYSTLINCGVLAPNEARKLEDLNPYEGGEEYLRPLNMASVNDDDLTARVSSVGALVRTGFEPASSLNVVGLPPIPYNDVQPVTVRPVDDEGLQLAPAATDAERALDPIRDEKIALIRSRKAQDVERGRDENATRDFAEKVLAPLSIAYQLAGVDLDVPALIEEALNG